MIQEKINAPHINANFISRNSSESTNGYLELGEEVVYTLNLTNDGNLDADNLIVRDYFSKYMNLESVKLNDEDCEYNKDIYSDDNLDILSIETKLRVGESLTLTIKGKVKENLIRNQDIEIKNKEEIFNIICLGETEEINYVIKKVGNDIISYYDPIKPNSPDNPNQSNTVNYSVSGRVWLDKNENGSKDSDEELLKEIKVYAINPDTNEIIKDENGNEISAITNDEGFYNLNLPKGEYLIVFEYNNNKYTVTTYEAENISDNNNSNAIKSNMKINGESKVVAVTDKINLTNGLPNINLGLIETKNLNLELKKYVSKIIVQNSSGTKTYNQKDGTTLAKVEIGSKVLNGSNVVIEYTIRVTNKGEASGYIKDIIDNAPTELKYSSTMNSDWYEADDGLHNVSLSNTIINPGESKEIKIIFTKSMTASNTGIINNKASIGSISSLAEVEVDKSDNEGYADVILGIKTGGSITYLILSLTIVSALCVIAYFINKKIIISRLKI